jgi:hypothetical protein
MPDQTVEALDRFTRSLGDAKSALRSDATADELREALAVVRELEAELEAEPELRVVLLLDPGVPGKLAMLAQGLRVLIESAPR